MKIPIYVFLFSDSGFLLKNLVNSFENKHKDDVLFTTTSAYVLPHIFYDFAQSAVTIIPQTLWLKQ
jgi:hypothetical protein